VLKNTSISYDVATLANNIRRKVFSRVTDLVRNIQISLIARNKQSQIIGICFGLTDFVYWLFITDLGIARSYEKQGLGKALMEIIHYANENAIPFYEKIGMKETKSMMIKDNIEWTEFVVE